MLTPEQLEPVKAAMKALFAVLPEGAHAALAVVTGPPTDAPVSHTMFYPETLTGSPEALLLWSRRMATGAGALQGRLLAATAIARLPLAEVDGVMREAACAAAADAIDRARAQKEQRRASN